MAMMICTKCGSYSPVSSDGKTTKCKKCGAVQMRLNATDGVVFANNLKTVKEEFGRNKYLLLQAGYECLKKKDFEHGQHFFDQVLTIDSKNSEAYLGKLMVELKVSVREELANQPEPFDNLSNYKKALCYGDRQMSNYLQDCIDQILLRLVNARYAQLYSHAVEVMNRAQKVNSSEAEQLYRAAAELFDEIRIFEDAEQLKEFCMEQAERILCSTAESYFEQMEDSASIVQGITVDDESNDSIGAENKNVQNHKAHTSLRKNIFVFVGIALTAVLAAFVVLLLIIPQSKYNSAMKLCEQGKHEEASMAFKALGNYKDSENRVLECQYNQAREIFAQGNYEEASAAFKALGNYKDSVKQILECRYSQAKEIFDQGHYEEATAVFKALDGYKDSNNLILASDYLIAEKYSKHTEIPQEDWPIIAIAYGKAIGYQDAKSRSYALWEHYGSRSIATTISAGNSHTVAIKTNGRAVAVGANKSGQCNVTKWTDLIKISAGYDHTVGLKFDGTVVATGDNGKSQCNVGSWSDIISIATGNGYTIGLKSDGTVLATGDNTKGTCDVYDWNNIVAVSAGMDHTVGLRADGTVITTGSNDCGKCNVSEWTNIIAISAGEDHTVGLKADGTVVATGYNGSGACNTATWSDIVSISAGGHHTVGLKKDGTVLSCGYNYYDQNNVGKWQGIVAISAGEQYTIGLKSNGTLVSIGDNSHGQRKISRWRYIECLPYEDVTFEEVLKNNAGAE